MHSDIEVSSDKRTHFGDRKTDSCKLYNREHTYGKKAIKYIPQN